MPKKIILVCLINFFIATIMGLALRFSLIESIGVNYRFLTHAHSHVAMLGWVYLMLYVLIVYHFVPEKLKIFNRLFWLTEFAVIGMMVSFPFQGYAAISISFSTLHIFCSYYFVYLIWKHHETTLSVSKKLLKTALLFMVLSTFGVWCLGPAVATLGQTSAFYQIAIQFFLHFQFNGWFLIAVLAVFFHLLQVENSKNFKQFFGLLIASTVLTFALPVQWFTPHDSLIWINGLGVIIQILVLYKCFQLIGSKFSTLKKNKPRLIFYIYSFALICFVLKVVLQSISIIPKFSQVVYQHRNFVIGFIHLLMLGVVTGFLFAFILKSNLVTVSKLLTFGIYSFVLGFLLTELLLLIQGIKYYFKSGLLPEYDLLLFIFSILLPLGIGFILFSVIRQKKHKALQP